MTPAELPDTYGHNHFGRVRVEEGVYLQLDQHASAVLSAGGPQ